MASLGVSLLLAPLLGAVPAPRSWPWILLWHCRPGPCSVSVVVSDFGVCGVEIVIWSVTRILGLPRLSRKPLSRLSWALDAPEPLTFCVCVMTGGRTVRMQWAYDEGYRV